MSSEPGVSVLIVNYNSGDRLARCIAALSAQTYRDFEVIVVDNASSDGSEEAAKGRAKLICLETNTGFAAGSNLAAKEASGMLLAFLNPDAYPEPSWLEALVEAAETHPATEAFGSLQISEADPLRLDGAGDVYVFCGLPYRGGFGRPLSEAPERGEIFSACAAGALYRRTAFEALGGFDESFFCYGEDVDLGFRLRLMGGRALHVPGAVLRHEGSGVTGRRSDFAVYYGYRNRLTTYLRAMPLSLLLLGLPLHMAYTLALGLALTAKGRAGPFFRAIGEALDRLPRTLKERRALRAERGVGTLAIAKALTYSPLKPLRRLCDVRPLPDRRPNGGVNR
ncbi:MAG: glycosyltransferase family 2 protein [Parvularcula sp.]|jgi:GT2 family glycosyltransferase|nr:glycosyltransferase family 2 protein [Parvularcula sp.]